MKAMLTGKNYIGEGLSKEGNITFKTFDPAKNVENQEVFYEASSEEIENAVTKAVKAFKIYKFLNAKKKAEFLDKIAAKLEEKEVDLIEIYQKESGLPAGRAKGELARTCNQLRSFSDLLRRGSWVEATISNAEGKPDIRKMLVPIGPVAVFGASNFPFAFSTAGGDTASALAAGVPVIVKSHPMHAGTGEMVSSAIIEAAKECQIPDGVFSNLNSKDAKVGRALVKHPQIKAVGFTGSFRGGMALKKLADERSEPIPVYAEMGSVNPMIILPSALQNNDWPAKLAQSVTLGAGQFCTNPGIMLTIENESLDNFISELKTEIEKINPSVMLGPGIKNHYDSSKSSVLNEEGYTEVAEFPGKESANCGKQKIISVPGKAFLQNKKFHQEVFGPFSIIVRCKDKKELNEILSSLEGQLTGSVLSDADEELKLFEDSFDLLKEKVGRLIFNGVPTGVEVCSAMMHGGPFPATSDSKYTSVGTDAIKRWVRPVAYQDWPDKLLPEELKNENPLGIVREINNELTSNPIKS